MCVFFLDASSRAERWELQAKRSRGLRDSLVIAFMCLFLLSRLRTPDQCPENQLNNKKRNSQAATNRDYMHTSFVSGRIFIDYGGGAPVTASSLRLPFCVSLSAIHSTYYVTVTLMSDKRDFTGQVLCGSCALKRTGRPPAIFSILPTPSSWIQSAPPDQVQKTCTHVSIRFG